MHSAWFRSTFFRVLKFLQMKEEGPNFWWQPILQKVWIIWSPLLHFNFKSFKYRISSSFISFESILHDSGVLSSESSNFYKLKKGNVISGGTNFAECLNYLVVLLYFNFKSFIDPNSSSFIKFQCFLHDSGALFSESSNFYKLKKGDLVSGENQICTECQLFGLPFSISILKVLWSHICRHSFDFNALCMIQDYFSQSFQISTN